MCAISGAKSNERSLTQFLKFLNISRILQKFKQVMEIKKIINK